jgi:hypothetical protein
MLVACVLILSQSLEPFSLLKTTEQDPNWALNNTHNKALLQLWHKQVDRIQPPCNRQQSHLMIEVSYKIYISSKTDRIVGGEKSNSSHGSSIQNSFTFLAYTYE